MLSEMETGVNNNNECHIGAGIVTYNPDLCRLKENLDAILAQVEGLVIVDNGSDNVEDICGLVEGRQDITVIWNEKNCGIARALNQVVEHAANIGWQWVLTADQDSVMMEGLVDNYRGYMGFEKIGMMTCLFLDRNFGIQQEHEFEGEYRFAERCITSGCLTNVAAVREVGGFDEAMFIDYVDFDMCYTLREHGYRILQSHFRGVLHELGSKGERKFFFGREVIVTNHSPARRYYYSRNVVYFIRKHRGHVNALRYYIKLYGRLGVVIVYEKNKCSKLRQGFRGIVDGYRMPLP
jgi:rhamnosyltransferase